MARRSIVLNGEITLVPANELGKAKELVEAFDR